MLTETSNQSRLLSGEYFQLQKRAMEIAAKVNANPLVCDSNGLSADGTDAISKAYAVAGIYLSRQILAISLQLELFVALPMKLSTDILNEVLDMYQRTVPVAKQAEANQLLPLSELDQELMAAAKNIQGLGSANFSLRKIDAREELKFQSFAIWRSKLLKELASLT